jgi:hypothetical protein
MIEVENELEVAKSLQKIESRWSELRAAESDPSFFSLLIEPSVRILCLLLDKIVPARGAEFPFEFDFLAPGS